MKKALFTLGAIVVIISGIFIFRIFLGLKPIILNPPVPVESAHTEPAPADTASHPGQNQTNLQLHLPDNTVFSLLAKDIPGARVIALDASGNLWVSQTAQGKITEIFISDKKATSQKTILTGLQKPHGLAFDPNHPEILYLAETTKISRYDTTTKTLTKIISLPAGGRHFTRTLGFGPDNRLYVSIGSTCDVCREADERNAAIYSLKPDGSDFQPVARGLRNSVFFRWQPQTQKLWATEMGRDNLGDNLPPDEINIIRSGQNYGWPICFGQNIHDTNFDKNTYVRNPCETPFETPAFIDLPAHSAPLGLAFFPTAGWGQDEHNDLLVAFHGSWNRTTPTGYKIVKIDLDENGKYLKTDDFISGFLTPDNRAQGRPVDIIILADGTAYISDDKAGAIYRLEYIPVASR